MALDSEIGTAVLVDELSLERSDFGVADTVTMNLNDFEIYMGLCEADELGTQFDANFLPGSRTLVYSRDPLTVSAAPWQWIDLPLDTPYWYDGQHNLLLEFQWSSGSGTTEHFLTWHWDSGTDRGLSAGYGESTGELTTLVDLMQISGTLSLGQETFGAIKVLLGR